MDIEQRLETANMYQNPHLVKKFALLEENQKHNQVSEIIDLLVKQEFEHSYGMRVAELGGGAHPDRYDWLFARLMAEPTGKIDWVDTSLYMLREAELYLNKSGFSKRREVINFIEQDIFDYLFQRNDNSLDLCLMKYTFEEIKDIDLLFSLLSKKMKSQGKAVTTIGVLNPEMRSFSTNARFLYNGSEFPLNETRLLKDGDTYTVKFFNESGNPQGGYLVGAQVTKYYHSPEKLKYLANKFGFEIYLGDWKDYLISDPPFRLDQDVMLLYMK
jgi:ubiquinone/menaquinone biosynthesis C-methylase UbiE